MFITTNGQLLTGQISDELIKSGFDDILISLHASNAETYKKIIGSNFDNLVKNIDYLVANKHKNMNIGIVFALNKNNWHNYTDIIDFTHIHKLNYINLIHTYTVGNSADNLSFYDNPIEGMRIINAMYHRAEILNVNIKPKVMLSFEDLPNKKPCYMPWNNIKFDGCLNYPDSYYVSVCNRINLFRINYKEFDFSNFHALWNHPLLQYLRKNESNPICSFCKNPNTPKIRNTDHIQYCKLRDSAVKEFFKNSDKELSIIKGLYILSENPFN